MKGGSEEAGRSQRFLLLVFFLFCFKSLYQTLLAPRVVHEHTRGLRHKKGKEWKKKEGREREREKEKERKHEIKKPNCDPKHQASV